MMWEIIPKPGKIRIYTSGWPKNQKRCWYKIGSPPPAGSKNVVLKFRSVNNIVIAPANTGRERSRRIAVRRILHTNKGIRSSVIPSLRMFMIVVIKLAAPRILLTPAKWSEKIPKSTAPPGCPAEDRGGYTVHPVPTPLSTKPDVNNNIIAGGSNQKLILFIRGKAMSGALIISGVSQLPKPPTIVGMTKKKIMIKACAVTITLYNWSSPNMDPVLPNSKRISALREEPMKADQIPNRKYNVPISLWLVENNQRVIFSFSRRCSRNYGKANDLQSLA